MGYKVLGSYYKRPDASHVSVEKMLNSVQDQITKACQSLYEKLITLTDELKIEIQENMGSRTPRENIVPDRRSTRQQNLRSNLTNRSVFRGWR